MVNIGDKVYFTVTGDTTNSIYLGMVGTSRTSTLGKHIEVLQDGANRGTVYLLENVTLLDTATIAQTGTGALAPGFMFAGPGGVEMIVNGVKT